MADQQDQNNIYGPPAQQEKMPAPTGYGGTAAGLAGFANAFLTGARNAQIQKYAMTERRKQESERNFDSVMAHIQENPNISQEGKQAAWQQYLTNKYSQVNEGMKGAKDNKDHPIMNMTRAITGAVLGPGQDVKHKDLGIDVNSLLNIANDPKYKQDPAAIGAIGGGAPAPQPGQGAAPAAQPDKGFNLPGAPTAAPLQAASQQATAPTSPPPGTSPAATGGGWKYKTQEEALADPAFTAQMQRIRASGQDFAKTDMGIAFASTPKSAAGLKALGAPYTVTEKVNGVDQQRTKRQFMDAGGQVVTMDLGEGKQSGSAPTLQHQWIQRAGSEIPEVGYINPKKPGGYVDYKGRAIEGEVTQVQAPTEGSGVAANYRQMAEAELAREGVDKPTRAQIRRRAGDIAEAVTGSPMARREQEEAMDRELSGIGPGPGLTGRIKRPEPAKNALGAPVVSPSATPTPPPPGTAPGTTPGATAAPTTPPPGTTPAASNGKPKTATSAATHTTPPPAAKSDGERAGPSTLTPAEESDATYYIGSLTGTSKGGGKGGAIKAKRGLEALTKRTGLSGNDLEIAVGEYQADRKALSDAVQVAGAFGRVQETLKEHGKVLEEAARNYGPGNTPLANRTWQWIQANSQAHPELTKYVIAVNAVQREYGRLISGGAQSRAMLPVAAIQQGEAVIRPDATMKDIVAAVQQLRLEADTEQKAFGQQQATIKNKMANSPMGRAFRQSAPGAGGTSSSGGHPTDAGIKTIPKKSGGNWNIGDSFDANGQTYHIKGFWKDTAGNHIETVEP